MEVSRRTGHFSSLSSLLAIPRLGRDGRSSWSEWELAQEPRFELNSIAPPHEWNPHVSWIPRDDVTISATAQISSANFHDIWMELALFLVFSVVVCSWATLYHCFWVENLGEFGKVLLSWGWDFHCITSAILSTYLHFCFARYLPGPQTLETSVKSRHSWWTPANSLSKLHVATFRPLSTDCCSNTITRLRYR